MSDSDAIDRLRRDVDDTDAGAVPGCTTECAKLREENAELRRLAYLGEHYFPDLTWKARAAELIAALASLRADAEAVRAVEEWRNKEPGDRHIGVKNGGSWFALSLGDEEGGYISAGDIWALGRLLIAARRQEEGQTDNG